VTLRQDIQREVLDARDHVCASPLNMAAYALAVNAAFARVGQKGNNDRSDLVQIAALVMAMAETAALNGDKVRL